MGNTFVVPKSWADDYPELSEWVGSNAYWKVVHTTGFEPLVTLESRVRAERVDFSLHTPNWGIKVGQHSDI